MTQTIAIITVNYNGLVLTSALLDSLCRNVTTPLEIIVVDNGSSADEAAVLKQHYPHIKAIRSELNLGFAGGNNLGMRAATSDYLLLLNNDTEVEQDTLHLLAETLNTHPEAGAVCPKIRFFSAPRSIQFAGYTPLTSITLRNSLVGFGVEDGGAFDTPGESPYAHGAAMMIRREVLEKVGLMPDCYFLYYEELDWSERIREQGYTIRYDPRSTVFHKESATTGQASPLRSFYLTRNRLLFASRNRHGMERLLAICYQFTIAAPKSMLMELLHGRVAQAAAILRGLWAFIQLQKRTI